MIGELVVVRNCSGFDESTPEVMFGVCFRLDKDKDIQEYVFDNGNHIVLLKDNEIVEVVGERSLLYMFEGYKRLAGDYGRGVFDECFLEAKSIFESDESKKSEETSEESADS